MICLTCLRGDKSLRFKSEIPRTSMIPTITAKAKLKIIVQDRTLRSIGSSPVRRCTGTARRLQSYRPPHILRGVSSPVCDGIDGMRSEGGDVVEFCDVDCFEADCGELGQRGSLVNEEVERGNTPISASMVFSNTSSSLKVSTGGRDQSPHHSWLKAC